MSPGLLEELLKRNFKALKLIAWNGRGPNQTHSISDSNQLSCSADTIELRSEKQMSA